MLAGKKTESAYAVVEVDEDEAFAGLLDDFGAIVVGVGVLGVAAALDVDPDGEVGVGGCAGGLVDVDEEAVFGVVCVCCLADGYADWAELL